MRIVYLPFMVLFGFAATASAAKFGLVVGGAALGKGVHDTARVTASVAMGLKARPDYQTTYLLSDGRGSEEKKFKEELDYIQKTVKPDGAASEENIDAAFSKLVAETKQNDQVEIFINAHGGCVVPGPDCEHFIEVYDRNGQRRHYPTDKLIGFLKKLDAKGVKTTLTLEACFSGALDSQVKRLKNTCSFLLSSPYSVGMGCYTNIPLEKKYYTSTVEVLALRYYQNVLPEISKGFYRDNSCFNHVMKHVSEHIKTDQLDSAYNAYWQGMVNDSNNHRPLLSSTREEVHSLLNRFDRQGEDKPICSPASAQTVAGLAKDVFGATQEKYFSALVKYDALIKEQKSLIASREDFSFVASKQNQMANQRENEIYSSLGNLSQEILRLEREILYQSEKNQVSKMDDPCKRPL